MAKEMQNILLIGGAILVIMFLTGNLKLGGTTTTPPGPNSQPSAGCAFAPSVAVTGIDGIVTSTTATPTTVNYIRNGQYVGTSAPAVQTGDTWSIVADLTGYLATDVMYVPDTNGNLVSTTSTKIGCGAQTFLTKPMAYADATVTIKDDSIAGTQTQRLTNVTAGTTNVSINATKSAAGALASYPITLQGTSQKSTGKIFVVVETPANSAVNISTLALNGATTATIPQGVSAVNAGSLRQGFEIPAIVGSDSKTYNLQIQTLANKVLVGTVLVTYYAEQKFVDANGVVEEGIYDSTPNGNNAAKYQDVYTSNFIIGN